MRYIFLTLTVIFFLSATIQAQTLEHSIGGTIADSLMIEWTNMWNSDDIYAISELYASDVILQADTLANGLIGKTSVVEATASRMAETGA